MENLSLTISIIMEFVFAIVTGFIAFYSFKVYKIAKQKELRLFGIGFISIALSYVVWALLNLRALLHITSTRLGELGELLKAINLLTIGAYIHIVLFLIGLAIISFVTLKSNNFEYLSLIIILSLVPIAFGANHAFLFYIVSIVFFVYLTSHYMIEYNQKKSKSLIRLILAFTFLSIGTLMLIFSGANYTNYLIGHVFSFAAYAILLINLIVFLKHGKKAK